MPYYHIKAHCHTVAHSHLDDGQELKHRCLSAELTGPIMKEEEHIIC